jgi:hypothetical protein
MLSPKRKTDACDEPAAKASSPEELPPVRDAHDLLRELAEMQRVRQAEDDEKYRADAARLAPFVKTIFVAMSKTIDAQMAKPSSVAGVNTRFGAEYNLGNKMDDLEVVAKEVRKMVEERYAPKDYVTCVCLCRGHSAFVLSAVARFADHVKLAQH